jgi:cytochrome b
MNDAAIEVRVWDLPTRAFHWALALCVGFSVLSAHLGGNALVWHFRCGYAVFALLVFRLVWGVVGGRWSRFSTFVYRPSTVLRYLRGGSEPHEHHDVGHSPLGAFSVFALLGLLALQVGTGLFADDEIANTGPLIKFVSGTTSLALTWWHKDVGQWLLVALVAVHVGAILFYLLRLRRNLLRPMIVGDKRLAVAAPPSVDNLRSRFLAALVLAVSAATVAWVVYLGA